MADALTEQLLAEIDVRVADLGFDLVDVRLGGTASRARLQVRLERPGGEPGITVDDCAQVSRALEAWLDADGRLGERYLLEVSSPGIERPVRWLRHWQRFVGRDVNVRLQGLGRRRARIAEVDAPAGTVTLVPEGAEAVTLPVERITNATLAVDWESSGLRFK
ncbi:MAG: ribosome maturation factor RimP [Gemmatimonadales bacterium]